MAASHYRIVPTETFQKDFDRMDAGSQRSVLRALEFLKEGRFHQVRKLAGVKTGAYRLRVGDYQIRFDLFGRDVALYTVRHRREVYREG